MSKHDSQLIEEEESWQRKETDENCREEGDKRLSNGTFGFHGRKGEFFRRAANKWRLANILYCEELYSIVDCRSLLG